MLVEVRISPGKGKLKRAIREIHRGAGIRGGRCIPHLTLYGPFGVDSHQFGKVLYALNRVGRPYDCLPFLIDSLDWEDHPDGRGRFIYFNVVPSKDFETFSDELRSELQMIAPSYKSYDEPGEELLCHITVATHLRGGSFDRAWSYLSENKSYFERLFSVFFGSKESKKPKDFYLPLCGLRVTLLNDKRKIAYEYDLPAKKMLNRREALSRHMYKRTLETFRIKNNLQLTRPSHAKGPSIYLMGDLHLDHANIIRYCARPFADVGDMNEVLLNNWNRTITDKDKVIYLGDLAYGKSSRGPDYWIPKLNGDITFLQGNHDGRLSNSQKYTTFEYKGHKFLACHYPDRIPFEWKDWVIHGHKHNNDIRNYPFINGEKKTINVSAELVDYKPLNLDKLLSLNLGSIKRMDTVSSKPVSINQSD